MSSCPFWPAPVTGGTAISKMAASRLLYWVNTLISPHSPATDVEHAARLLRQSRSSARDSGRVVCSLASKTTAARRDCGIPVLGPNKEERTKASTGCASFELKSGNRPPTRRWLVSLGSDFTATNLCKNRSPISSRTTRLGSISPATSANVASVLKRPAQTSTMRSER